jgi:hypothetical protein
MMIDLVRSSVVGNANRFYPHDAHPSSRSTEYACTPVGFLILTDCTSAITEERLCSVPSPWVEVFAERSDSLLFRGCSEIKVYA